VGVPGPLRAAALLLACAVACARQEQAPVSPVRFVRERVVVEVAEGQTRVVGTYVFRNTSDGPRDEAMFYPFPIDREHLYPSRVEVEEQRGDSLAPLGFTPRDMGVAWRLRFDAGEERVVRVEYSQRTLARRAVYIVTTTKSWRRPIERAEFEFRVPATLRGVRVSFEPDRVASVGDTVLYIMAREQFMPDEDLVVTWE
jgi:hypothetical protein